MGLKGGGNVLRTLNNSVERMLIATMEPPQGPRSQSAETHDLNEEGQEEAADMDPQQRLFLEVSLEALNDAMIQPSHQGRNNIGIFIGSAENSYHKFTDPVYGDPFQQANRGFVAPSISARTAYHLDLHGPNITLNTNCASGTVALSLAVDGLRSGRCDTAIVGGISVQLYK